MTSFLLAVSLLISCDSLNVDFSNVQLSERETGIEGYDSASFIGALNAVRKAYQLTDILFSPNGEIEYNTGVLSLGDEHRGMIYSSVKEIGTYVGTNVSFHTFITAVNNPRSKLYTEHLNKPPYHGKNCRAYYGTVCSGLVSYALGLFPIMASYDFDSSSLMTDIKFSSSNDVHIADILWKPGHVAMITDVIRDGGGEVVSIEVSEAIQSGCHRKYYSKSSFKSLMNSSFKKILRYNNLCENTFYIEQSKYVSVLDETPSSFEQNNDICVDKGDESNYLKGESVVINLLNDFNRVDLFRNGSFYRSIELDGATDVVLSDLEYGHYLAYGIRNDYTSEPTSWIVVDYSLSVLSENTIQFSSYNSTPISIHFCKISGDRVYPASELLCRSIRDEEIINGIIDLSDSPLKDECPYFVMGFKTEYGNAFTLPMLFRVDSSL